MATVIINSNNVDLQYEGNEGGAIDFMQAAIRTLKDNRHEGPDSKYELEMGNPLESLAGLSITSEDAYKARMQALSAAEKIRHREEDE